MAGDIGIMELNVCPPICRSDVPLWLIPNPNVDLYFLKTNKRKMSEVVVEEIKTRQCQMWGGHLQIYTDGSKDPESGKGAFGISIQEIGYKKGWRIPDHMSVFTAELVAVLWAVRWVEDNKREYSVKCSDSAATLTTIKECKSKSRPDVLVEILQVLYRIHKAGYEVGFLWVPAHMGVEGNEEADEMAKKAVQEERVQFNLQYGSPDYTEIINRAVKEMWQRSWECERNGRDYYVVQRMVEKDRCKYRCQRRDAVVITRMRLGHCGLRSGLALIGKHPDGHCECGDKETVMHVLVQCRRYSHQRRKLFRELGETGETVFNLCSLLNLDSWNKVKKLMEYLRSIGVYKKI